MPGRSERLPGPGVGAEVDSKERHGQQESLDDTLVRHDRADTCGLSLVHGTPTRYRSARRPSGAGCSARWPSGGREVWASRQDSEVVPRGPLLS